jgi:hypothetical protein
MIQSDLISYLLTNSSITVSAFYPSVAPTDPATPFAVWSTNDNRSPFDGFDGVSELKEIDIQMDVFHADPSSASAYASEIIAQLENFRGTMGSYYVDLIRVTSQQDGFENVTNLYFHSLLFTLTYRN